MYRKEVVDGLQAEALVKLRSVERERDEWMRIAAGRADRIVQLEHKLATLVLPSKKGDA